MISIEIFNVSVDCGLALLFVQSWSLKVGRFASGGRAITHILSFLSVLLSIYRPRLRTQNTLALRSAILTDYLNLGVIRDPPAVDATCCDTSCLFFVLIMLSAGRAGVKRVWTGIFLKTSGRTRLRTLRSRWFNFPLLLNNF